MNILQPKMLPRAQSYQGYGEAEVSFSPEGGQGITFDFIYGFLRRHVRLIVACALLSSGLGGLFFFVEPPPFTAVATLAIDTSKFQLFSQQTQLGEQSIDSSPAVESQLEVLKSENVALKVINNLRLADDDDFGKSVPIPILSSFFMSQNVESESWRTRNALRVFQNSLTVKRIGAAYVIDISFAAKRADQAAQIANAVANTYIADQLDVKYQATRFGSRWLEARLGELRNQVSDAQKAVNDYKAKFDIVNTGNGRLISEQQLSELNSRLTMVRTRKAEVRAKLDRITANLANGSDASIIGAGDGGDNNPLLTKLRTQYLEAAAREGEWSEKYGPNHIAAVNLRNNMQVTRNAIRSELSRVQESLRTDYEIAEQEEKNLQGQLQGAIAQSQTSDEAQVKLRDLEASAQAYKVLYDNFLKRYTEAVEQQSFPYTEARLITKAAPPLQRTYKKTILLIAAAPFLGLFLGVGLGALREYFDSGFRTSLQLETALHTNCLALVPGAESWTEGQGSLTPPGPEELTRWVIDRPFSQFAESIRNIKLAIDLNAAKIVGVTSSIPGEGKSTLSCALAQSIAQVGARAILVDCDLRNPSLSSMLAPETKISLVDVLSEPLLLDKAIVKVRDSRLSFLPAPVAAPVAHSSDILASKAMQKLIDKLQVTYDYVIIDLPPMAPVIDVRATTTFINAYIFIVEWGKTSTAVAQHALTRAPHVHERLLGAVLNKVNMKSLSLYEGNRAGYYNDKSYARYYHN